MSLTGAIRLISVSTCKAPTVGKWKFLYFRFKPIGGSIMIVLREKTGTLMSADGVKIFYRHYAAESEPARVVIGRGLEDWLEERLGMTNREFRMWNAESGLTNG
jgi:hypothetical protein